jgi:hypothetical protein
MIFCAASASFQRSGSSAFSFSSARRFVALSTSKMPPQQSQGLLGGFDERFDFRAHGSLSSGMKEEAREAAHRPSGNSGTGGGGQKGERRLSEQTRIVALHAEAFLIQRRHRRIRSDSAAFRRCGQSRWMRYWGRSKKGFRMERRSVSKAPMISRFVEALGALSDFRLVAPARRPPSSAQTAFREDWQRIAGDMRHVIANPHLEETPRRKTQRRSFAPAE